MTVVIFTEEFRNWFHELAQYQRKAVRKKAGVLETMGVALPFPHSSAIEGTDFPLRELRIKAKGDQIRVIYAFDPERQAVLLIGGNKVGDDRFYTRIIPQAERIWKTYLEDL